jgi:hypothetical protein
MEKESPEATTFGGEDMCAVENIDYFPIAVRPEHPSQGLDISILQELLDDIALVRLCIERIGVHTPQVASQKMRDSHASIIPFFPQKEAHSDCETGHRLYRDRRRCAMAYP